jgi:hypothetical protein
MNQIDQINQTDEPSGFYRATKVFPQPVEPPVDFPCFLATLQRPGYTFPTFYGSGKNIGTAAFTLQIRHD